MKDYEPKGRWTPEEFFKLPNLSCLDRFVLSCIYGLDDNGCTASDSYIAKLIIITERQARRSIMKMHQLGYIQIECERGVGIHGTKRKIFCKISVKTTLPKSVSGLPTTLPKSVSGFDQKRSVVLEGTQSISKLQSTEKKSDTIELHKNSTVQKGNSHKELGEESTPYQTQVETHKMEWLLS